MMIKLPDNRSSIRFDVQFQESGPISTYYGTFVDGVFVVVDELGAKLVFHPMIVVNWWYVVDVKERQ